MTPERLAVKNFGQIGNADVRFGDLTVFVGPQATGKSIFLQFLKLVIDAPSIQSEFKRFGIDWEGNLDNLVELYFGEGYVRSLAGRLKPPEGRRQGDQSG